MSSRRCRVRSLGVMPGVLATGPLNAITDVVGVLVGHVTLQEGDGTGVTAILSHPGNEDVISVNPFVGKPMTDTSMASGRAVTRMARS